MSPTSRFLCRKRRKGLRRRGKALIIFSRKEGKRRDAMEIRQLKYFLSAAKHLSFTTAAQECYIVQSAMSQQIAALEKELGVTLFERGGRTMALTAEGRAFRQEAEKILRQVTESTVLVQTISFGYGRTLRVGCHGNLLHRELVSGLARLHRDKPELRVLMFQDIAVRLLESLRNKELDCVISTWVPELKLTRWLDWQIVREEQVRLMVSTGHPLAGRQQVTMEEIAREPMILLNGSDKREHLIRWADSGNPVRVYCYAEDPGSVEVMVAAGFGVSLCMESACRPREGVAYVDIQGHHGGKVVLLWNRGEKEREAAQELLSVLQIDPSKAVI